MGNVQAFIDLPEEPYLSLSASGLTSLHFHFLFQKRVMGVNHEKQFVQERPCLESEASESPVTDFCFYCGRLRRGQVGDTPHAAILFRSEGLC
jgi:hypothetical protein